MTTPIHSTPSKPLHGKVALVTGGSRGIGAAIARRLAADGADVAISYAAAADKAEAVIRSLEEQGVRAAAFKADQGDSTQVAGLVRDVAARFGRLDILVNNAGVFAMGVVGDPQVDLAALDRQLAVNIGGVIAAVRKAAGIIGEGGRIITVGSNGAISSLFAGSAEYAGTKAAVAAFSRGWARDLGPKGITVNTVQPGPVETDMNPASGDFAEMLKSRGALGRYGQPDEIAAVVAFLASPSAAYVTGATITADGGVTA